MTNKLSIKNLKTEMHSKLDIVIEDDDKHYLGRLTLIRPSDLKNDFYIESLTKWRTKFMRYFLTQFPASVDKTRIWLKDIVLPSENRLLFFIFDSRDNLVGNFGVANICGDRCELDNLIRGERGGHPKLIYFSEIALLKWLFGERGMNFVNLHVFSSNSLTLKLHKSVGFEEIGRKPLYKSTDKAGNINYNIKDMKSSLEVENFEYVEMAMDLNLFRTLHPIKQGNN